MGGCLGINISKSENQIIFIDDRGRNFFTDNFAKNSLAHRQIAFFLTIPLRDLRFDNVPFGRTQFAPTFSTKSVTVGAQSLRPPLAQVC